MIEITEAFDVVVELAVELGVKGINELEGAWICKIDKHWVVAINGKDKPVAVEIEDSMGCQELQPFEMAIFFNGWLAGLLNPGGGMICAGKAANEDTFIAAVRARIEVEKLAKELAK